MRCTIPLPALFHLLRDCITLIPARPNLPITGHLLISATDDHITITATNLETTVTAQCPASVTEAGTVTLPGKKFYEVLKELSGETITLTQTPTKLETTLTSKGSRMQLIGLPPQEFPAIPVHPAPPLWTMPQEELHRLLSETLPSIGPVGQTSLDALRVEWHPTALPTIRLVATDGKRLTQSQLTTGTWITRPDTAGHALLSHPTAQILHRLLHVTHHTALTIGVSQSLLTVTLPQLHITTRLVDSSYPKYESLVPAHLSPCLELARKDCIDSLARLAIIAPQHAPTIDLSLTTTGLVLRADNPQLGHAREEIAATIFREGFTIRVNARYLLDALTTAPADHITVNMETPESPCILTNGNPTRWRAIIMPIRIGETNPTRPA